MKNEKIDEKLEQLTEEYLTKRFYAPRVQLSDEFKSALRKEIVALKAQNLANSRISNAIAFQIETNLYK